MAKEVHLRDVSERAGCSVGLASIVLNGRQSHVHASVAMRERILMAAEELGYVPNRNARGLRLSRSFLIGVIAGSLDSSFVPEILAGIESRCLNSNYGVLIGASQTEAEFNERWENFLRRGVDGIICIGRPSENARFLLNKCKVKCVCIGGGRVEYGIGGVWVEREPLCRLAAQAFAERGHRHVGYLTLHSVESCGSWLEELSAHGVEAGPVVKVFNGFDEGVLAAEEMLKAHPDVTGVFADSDLLGTAVIAAARRIGREVPSDLSVLGIDDSILCRVCQPELSSLRQPRREQGEKAAELLMNMLDGGVPRNIVLQGSLVCRGSLTTLASRVS